MILKKNLPSKSVSWRLKQLFLFFESVKASDIYTLRVQEYWLLMLASVL